jgi:hypothetical protein
MLSRRRRRAHRPAPPPPQVRTVNFSHHTDKLFTGGMEKLIRIYDCNQPESDPVVIEGAASNIRCSAWIQNDSLLLISYLDKPGMRCAAAAALLPPPAAACGTRGLRRGPGADAPRLPRLPRLP